MSGGNLLSMNTYPPPPHHRPHSSHHSVLRRRSLSPGICLCPSITGMACFFQVATPPPPLSYCEYINGPFIQVHKVDLSQMLLQWPHANLGLP